jgi:putative intracellular protease/amidase
MPLTKPKAYLLVFPGFADWEPAHAFCEINRSGKFEVFTVGFSRDPVTSMAGLRVSPAVTIHDVHPADAAFFMLPGGDLWQEKSQEQIHKLLHALHANGVLIGAICAATLEIARAGLTHGIRHTSNGKAYLESMVPGYQDGDLYVDELAVADGTIITASGLGSVEFAREVQRHLKIHGESEIALWFDMFKNGVVPAGMA